MIVFKVMLRLVQLTPVRTGHDVKVVRTRGFILLSLYAKHLVADLSEIFSLKSLNNSTMIFCV